jgi:hypothetical protein
VAGGIKLDIRRLNPSDVVGIALPLDKQDQQNVRKLRGMNAADWSELVDFIDTHGNAADLEVIQKLLRLQNDQQAEALAARANMTAIVRTLHDSGSQLMDMLLEALAAGKLCIVDVSQLRGVPSLILSGLILRRIFDRNQEEFTKAVPRTIPTIAVVEEAQTVMGESSVTSAPYVEWVKEGRKYDLGAVLITQQPGSIPGEILSQVDNWFVFHLLSAGDLQSVHKANAHFSDDLLRSLLNEPIRGQGVFWSSVAGRPYPVPVRVLSFEALFRTQDPGYDREGVRTFARDLRDRYQQSDLGPAPSAEGNEASPAGDGGDEERVDAFRMLQERAVSALRENLDFRNSIESGGIPWGKVVGLLRDVLPATMDDRDRVAYTLVPRAMTEILGASGVGWTTERRGPKQTLFIVKKVG